MVIFSSSWCLMKYDRSRFQISNTHTPPHERIQWPITNNATRTREQPKREGSNFNLPLKRHDSWYILYHLLFGRSLSNVNYVRRKITMKSIFFFHIEEASNVLFSKCIKNHFEWSSSRKRVPWSRGWCACVEYTHFYSQKRYVLYKEVMKGKATNSIAYKN